MPEPSHKELAERADWARRHRARFLKKNQPLVGIQTAQQATEKEATEPPPYAELHCLTHFSFQRGASSPEELVRRAWALGYTALAITDECSVAGVVRAWSAHKVCARAPEPGDAFDDELSAVRAARRAAGVSAPLQLLFGSEFRFDGQGTLVAIARDLHSWGDLCSFITACRRAAPKGHHALPPLAQALAALRRCALLWAPAKEGSTAIDSIAACALQTSVSGPFDSKITLLAELHGGADDALWLAQLRALSAATGWPLAAAGDVHMHVRARKRLHDVMTAIRVGQPVHACGFALQANAERHLRPRERLAAVYPPDLLAATLAVAARCAFGLDEIQYNYPEEAVIEGLTPTETLAQLTREGAAWRFPKGVPPRIQGFIDKELALIEECRYEMFFLTVHDIVRWARGQGILCQGRGSAANSAVCWALGITEVDPGLGILLFERFISRERREPPDIDVDFEHERREEVIQYLYRKYGRERAALAATVITYRTRSAVRDVGRALGLDASLVERISREHQWFDGRGIDAERLRDAGLDPSSPALRQLLTLVGTLVGFPRHLSQHVGGFVIARGRLDELVPVENAAMPERTVIQWDKDDLDALGLLKVDVLALGMLSALRRGLALVSAWRGQPVTLAGIERERPEVYAMLTRADAIGVFQVESRAQLSMLPRLRPQCFYDLVVEVAIVRPGPVQGGMVHPYLQARECRARGEDPLQALRAEIRPVLARTLGVPIFQEQVMRLAVVAAGFTPGEADQLRRAMGSWRRQGELARYREQLLQGMAANGYDPDFAERLCRQIEGFGDYGFPESHAASFALLVYASAWLKCFEPAAFLAAMLNSQPMGFYSASQLIQDARRHDIEVRPPDVTVSVWDCTLEARSAADAQADAQPAVRLGLRLVRGLRREAAQAILAAREAAAFASVAELAARAQLDAATLRVLASSGSLAALAGHRRQAVWQATGAVPLPGLLAATTTSEAALALPAPAEAEELLTDYARLGFTLGRHPLALLRPQLTQLRFLDASAISAASDRMLARAAGLVTCRQRPATAKGTLFITLEDETGFTNVIVHPDVFERQRHILLGARLLGVYGQISRQASVVHLIAARVVDHSALLGELQVQSRDFH